MGVLLGLALGCGEPAAEDGRIRIDLDKSNPERLLRYYVAAYVPGEPADPFATGVLAEEEGTLWLDPGGLRAPYADRLAPAVGDGVLDWDELEAFVQETYYEAREAPETLEALAQATGYRAADSAWQQVAVDGVMTSARRDVYAPRAAIRQALADYTAQGGRLIYPVGTMFVGEHVAGGRFVEATVMQKRPDGFWDFFTYGPDGRLAAATQPLPQALETPVQCFGCHYGSRLYEPEKSFPSAAPDGPHGPRAVHVGDALRDADLVRHFDEHRRRSDGVLGLYGTLFVADLRAARAAGRLAPADAALLDHLGL